MLRRPAIQFLRSPIPVSDDIVHMTDEDAVVCQVQQACRQSFRHFDFKLIASLTKLSLDVVPDGAEPDDRNRNAKEMKKRARSEAVT